MLDRWYHPLLESRMGTFSFRTCMSSQTQSSAQAQVRWIQSMLQTNWEHNVESIMNSDNETQKRYCQRYEMQTHKCMSQNGHEPESFPDRNDIARDTTNGRNMLQTSILTSKTRNRSTRSGIFDEFDAAWPLWWEKGVNKTTSTKRRPSAEKFTSPHCWLFATWNIQNRRNFATIWRQNSLAKRYRQRRYWWLRGFHRTKSINVSHSSR